MLTFYQNDLAMRNTADMTVDEQSPSDRSLDSGVSAVNPLVVSNDIEVREKCVSFLLTRTPHEN
jgi:hypothetical protein